jgi:enolase-phosphatase E1
VARAVITDIEGTTTPIRFVKDVLFPYSVEALPDFLASHADNDDVRRILANVAREAALPADAPLEAYIRTLEGWITEDRKITSLKALQGLIWRDGYARGAFTAPVYDDVPRQLERWRNHGIALYVYSSGSVEAQQLLFGHTDHGDLTHLFSGWFDTRMGAKSDAASYRAICDAIDTVPAAALFLSDAPAELDAARAGGLRTVQLLRPGDGTGPADHHAQATSFDMIDPHAA